MSGVHHSGAPSAYVAERWGRLRARAAHRPPNHTPRWAARRDCPARAGQCAGDRGIHASPAPIALLLQSPTTTAPTPEEPQEIAPGCHLIRGVPMPGCWPDGDRREVHEQLGRGQLAGCVRSAQAVAVPLPNERLDSRWPSANSESGLRFERSVAAAGPIAPHG